MTAQLLLALLALLCKLWHRGDHLLLYEEYRDDGSTAEKYTCLKCGRDWEEVRRG